MPRTVVNATTGWIVEQTGWFTFFLLCTVLALPGMALLLRVAPWNGGIGERATAMNHHKFSAIAHRDHDYCNPISAAKVERLLDLLPLDETSRVLDLGCGRAELALRIIERFGSPVVAVDNSSLMLDAARERAEWTGALHKLHLDDIDIREFKADPETFHLTVMMGAGGHRRRHGRHLQHAEGLDEGRRLRAGRRGLLARRSRIRTTSRSWAGPTRSTSTTAATCRPASTRA